MKTRIALVLMIVSISLYGKEVPLETARTVAENFLILHISDQLKSSSSYELSLIQTPSHKAFGRSLKKSGSPGERLLYLFSINSDDGFIIISADDQAKPVLAYSLENEFNPDNVPENYQKWIEGYKKQIRYIKAHPHQVSDKTSQNWEQLKSGKSPGYTKSSSAVAPLLTTIWDQSPFVNDLCPYDETADERAVTGCVATAMAQIMNFWEYPVQGSGYHSYSHNLFGAVSANFGASTYDWEAMPDAVNAPSDAVATLMFHCGVSVEMDYSVESSGAYVISARSPIEHCSEYAFETYFAYDKSLRGVIRENYTTPAWMDLLKDEISNGRPIEYAGFGSGGGHAFVCDGFDDNDFFHFNWGWGGFYDGYFSIDALDPGGVGIGGGDGGFNSGHQAIIGIKPPSGESNYELTLYDSLSISENPLFYADPFIIYTDIANYGSETFSGDFSAAIFDKDYVFVEFAEVIEGNSLDGGFYNSFDFSSEGSLNFLPGDYYAGIYYRPIGENWMAVGDGAYSNLLEFKVYYSSDIELYSDFLISEGSSLEQHKAFTVSADILNDGAETFTGALAVDLYDMEGSFAQTVETRSGALLNAGYFYDDMVFTSGGLSVEPGTYLLALTHKADGGDWILSGSSYATNPIKVIVKAAPLSPDIYETNDSLEIAYVLTPNYVGHVASLDTEGSNTHTPSDNDFYKIELDAGYDYTISARAHDSYNSGNQEVYSNDVIWSYSLDDIWSDLYDDVMETDIAHSGAGELLFAVAPYFEGQTGTYLLDIQINRTEIVSSKPLDSNKLNIYPNPAKDILQVESSGIIDQVLIFDTRGRILNTVDCMSSKASLDISGLSEGIYFLHVKRANQSTIHKIVKQ
jgi:Peptidase C10 family/Spi protease inhibitor/Secretion system C-terminal sorting domain